MSVVYGYRSGWPHHQLQKPRPLVPRALPRVRGTRDLVVLQSVSKDFRSAIARWSRLFRCIHFSMILFRSLFISSKN
jgi:hypothetical protein